MTRRWGQRPCLQHLRVNGNLTFRSWKVRNVVALDQPKMAMKVAAETGEAAIGSVAAVEVATTVEEAELSMAETSSAVVVATAVAATAAAAVIAAVQAGWFFFPLSRWRFPQAHRTSPLEYPNCQTWPRHPKLQFFESLISTLHVLMECFEVLTPFLKAFIRHPERSAIFISPHPHSSCDGESFSPETALLLVPRDMLGVARHQGALAYL